MSEVPSIEEFMHIPTLKDMKNNRGWRPGTRTGIGPDPDTRADSQIGTAEDERGETN